MSATLRVFDGHLDLAMNAVKYNRDQTWPVPRLRAYEKPVLGRDDRGVCTVSLPELRRAGVAWFVGTIFSRAKPEASAEKCFLRSDADSAAVDIAATRAVAQLAYYQLLMHRGELEMVTTPEALDRATPPEASAQPIRFILLMEGGDPLCAPFDLAWWYGQGLRAVGLTHTEVNAYATGNRGDGPLTAAGRALLKEMASLGIALDLSHLCDASCVGALAEFNGPVFVSHANCRALCPGARQMPDDLLREVIRRDGVVGMVLHGPMIRSGFTPATYDRDRITLAHLADHIDHLCQLAGDARHVGLGTDLDGGFGREYAPKEIDTIADLPRLAEELSRRNYADAALADIFHGNWLRFWKRALAR